MLAANKGRLLPIPPPAEPSPPTTALNAWWKADSLSLAAGGQISQWNDSIGSNNLVQAVGASQPTYAVNQINGKPAVRFNAQFLTFSAINGITAAEIFGIIKNDLDPPVDAGLTGLWNFNSSGDLGSPERMHFPYTNSNIYDCFCSPTRWNVGNPVLALTSWRLYNTQSALDSFNARLDGGSLFSLSGANTCRSPTANCFIGKSRNYTSTDFFYVGYIAEILFYSAVVPTATRFLIHTYFNTKYALALPTS